MSCPRCAKPMKDVRGVSVCTSCGGAFVAAAAVDTVRRAFDDDAQSLAALAAQHASKRVDGQAAAACPVCAHPMARFRVGPVEVDTCFDHGSWYDRGELAAVKRALEAGLPTEAVDGAARDDDDGPAPAAPAAPSLELARNPVAPKAPSPMAGGGIDPGAAAAISRLRDHERVEAARARRWQGRHRRRHAFDLVEDILDILT